MRRTYLDPVPGVSNSLDQFVPKDLRVESAAHEETFVVDLDELFERLHVEREGENVHTG